MVELIPKKQQGVQLPHWIDALFYVALGIFIVAIVGFVIFNRLNKAADTDIQETQTALGEARSPERRALEANVILLQKKINDFAGLLVNHRETAKLFTNVEKIVHPQVWFSEISADTQKMTVKLSGRAKDFTSLDQQISILESNSRVKNIVLSNLNVSKEGEVQFSLSFTFDPGIFQAP